MSQELIFTVLYIIAFGAILATGEILHSILKIHTEYTRKFAHSTASLLSLTFPLVFNSYHHVLAMGIIFFFVLLIAQRKDLLRSINDVSRTTYGGVLLPVTITVSFVVSVWLNDTKLFIIPILILAVSDSLAGITGEFFGKRVRKIIIYKLQLNKTYLGSSVFLVTAFIISIYTLHWYVGNYSTKTIMAAVAVAVGAAIVEAFSGKGLDNLTVPMTALMILLMF
ncbi:MAG: hypothetical protein EA394_06230 [Bacteroidia bacterium]|nr:MAG: hypothetical protein EA394_06230 [Bacteroidia bacterium]